MSEYCALVSRHRIDHTLGVAVGGVDDDHVDACSRQSFGTLLSIRAYAKRSAHTETAKRILDRIRVPIGLQQVFDRDQADEIAIVSDDQELLDAVLVQQLACLVLLDSRRHGHQLLRHQLRNLLIQVLLESNVAAGENADRLGALDDRQPRNLVTPHQLERVMKRFAGAHGHRVDNHPRLGPLHLRDLERLQLWAHVLVQNSNAAFTRHGDRGAPFGHRVHCARCERNAQLQVARKTRRNVSVRGKKIRVSRKEQHVIKGECFPQDAVSHRNLPRTLKIGGEYSAPVTAR